MRSGSDPRGGGGGHAGSSSTGVRRSSLLGAMNGRRAAAEDEDSDESDDYTKPGPRKTGGPSGAPGSEAFARSAARQSLGNNPALLRWLDAQVRLQETDCACGCVRLLEPRAFVCYQRTAR